VYEPINNIPFNKYISRIKAVFKNYLLKTDFQVQKYIKDTIIPKFYGIVKIYKKPWNIRPIVPFYNNIFSKIEVLVDMLGKNCISQGFIILRDSRDLVARLRSFKGVTPLTRIYTGNVKVIYTNINTDLARNAF